MPQFVPSGNATATSKDVARLAGVSTAVVSYVVNGGPRKVSPSTEAKVRDAIAVLGYRPNAAARALKVGSSELLGMVIPDVTNPFFASLAHAVEEFAAQRGYAVLIANSNGSVSAERRLIENLANRGVDGIFLSSNLFEPDLPALEAATRIAMLSRSGEVPLLGYDSVGTDTQGGARCAVEHLVEHGHRRIGLVIGTNTGGGLDGREVGWHESLKIAGLSTGPIFRVPFTRDGGRQAGRRLLNDDDRPTAIFASSDPLAIGLLRAFHEAGVRVPEDIAIVSFDGTSEAEYTWPPLSTIAQPVQDIARSAVDFLLDGDNRMNSIFPATLIRRASCGC